MRLTQEAKILIGIGIVSLGILFGGLLLTSKANNQATQPVDENRLIRANSNQTATTSAKLTLVEFGDLQCPACKATHPTVQRMLKDFPSDVRFVFRHFPLIQHKNAIPAAKAAEAAGVQGKFWEMYDLLYAKQEEWSPLENPNAQFITYATSLSLEPKAFQEALEGTTFDEKITGDQADGNALNVRATPTFFINGKLHEGAVTYDILKRALDESKPQ